MKSQSWEACEREWLESKAPNSQKNYRSYWPEFKTFVNLTAQEILNEREKDFRLNEQNPARWRFEDLALKFYQKQYGDRDPPQPTSTDRLKLSSVQSFFAYWRMNLKFRRGQIEEPVGVRKDYEMKLVDLDAMDRYADPKENWIILGGKSVGQRAGDFVRIKRADIEPYLSEEPPIPIDIRTTKKNLVAHPCLDRDAVEAAKRYLASRTDNNPYMLPGYNDDHLEEHALTETLQRLADAAHREDPKICPYKERNEQLRFHNLRAFLNGALQNAGVDPDLRDYIVGHKLTSTKRAYTSHQRKESYQRAETYLLLPRLTNNVTPKIEKSLEEFAKLLFNFMPRDIRKQMAEEALKTQYAVKWDPNREPKPMIYILQEALKKATEG